MWGTQQMWKNVLWSDKTKILLFGLKAKRFVWRKTNTAHHLEHIFPSAGTRKLTRVGRKMDGAKHRTILEENLMESAKDLRLGRRFVFHQDNDPKQSIFYNGMVHK